MARRTRRGPTLIQRSRAVAPGQKALYHQVFGAGKSRVLRQFFDLNDDDARVIGDEMRRRITERLAQPR